MIDELREDVGSATLEEILADRKCRPLPLLPEAKSRQVAESAIVNLGSRAWHLFMFCAGKDQENVKNVASFISSISYDRDASAHNKKSESEYFYYLRVMRQIASLQ